MLLLLFEPSVNLAILLLILGIVLAVSCWRNLADAPVHYQLPGDRVPSITMLVGLVLGLLLTVGGGVVGYKALTAPPDSGCAPSG